MGHRLGLTSKLKPLGVGAAKASLNRANEFVGSRHVQDEGKVTLTGGPNPHLLKKVGMRCA
jgi:hypothetical protein